MKNLVRFQGLGDDLAVVFAQMGLDRPTIRWGPRSRLVDKRASEECN